MSMLCTTNSCDKAYLMSGMPPTELVVLLFLPLHLHFTYANEISCSFINSSSLCWATMGSHDGGGRICFLCATSQPLPDSKVGSLTAPEVFSQ